MKKRASIFLAASVLAVALGYFDAQRAFSCNPDAYECGVMALNENNSSVATKNSNSAINRPCNAAIDECGRPAIRTLAVPEKDKVSNSDERSEFSQHCADEGKISEGRYNIGLLEGRPGNWKNTLLVCRTEKWSLFNQGDACDQEDKVAFVNYDSGAHWGRPGQMTAVEATCKLGHWALPFAP